MEYQLFYNNVIILRKLASLPRGFPPKSFEGTTNSISSQANFTDSEKVMFTRMKSSLISNGILEEVGYSKSGTRGENKSAIYKVNLKNIRDQFFSNEETIKIIKILQWDSRFPR